MLYSAFHLWLYSRYIRLHISYKLCAQSWNFTVRLWLGNLHFSYAVHIHVRANVGFCAPYIMYVLRSGHSLTFFSKITSSVNIPLCPHRFLTDPKVHHLQKWLKIALSNFTSAETLSVTERAFRGVCFSNIIWQSVTWFTCTYVTVELESSMKSQRQQKKMTRRCPRVARSKPWWWTIPLN